MVKTQPKSTAAIREERRKAPVPADAPAFFKDAIAEAAAKEQPIIIDFWATWCVPCKRLKKETLENREVAAALDGVQLVFVDLDEYPGIAQAYGVKTVPDVFFVDADGWIIDRLRNFEAPKPFLERLHKLKH